MEQWLLESARTAGPIVALVIFFVWRDFKREANMTIRMREVEDFVKDKLLTALNQTTATISKNTEVLELTKTALSTVNELPCLTGEFREGMCSYARDHRS
jgi:hypothetical protein